jgi:hypothetical protein
MDQLITLLSNLLNLTKIASVTLPGLLSASAIAIFFWPQAPIDLIPIATPNTNREPLEFPVLHQEAVPTSVPACSVRLIPLATALHIAHGHSADTDGYTVDINQGVEDARGHGTLSPGFSYIDLSAARSVDTPDSVKYQLLLDAEQTRLAECKEVEAARKARDQALLDQLQKVGLSTVPNDSPHHVHAGAPVVKTDPHVITVLLAEVVLQSRDRNMAELKRYSDLIASRLEDPGRLRPRLNLNAYFSELTNHVVGFILLSIAFGVVMTAISNSLFRILLPSPPT